MRHLVLLSLWAVWLCGLGLIAGVLAVDAAWREWEAGDGEEAGRGL